MKIYLAKNVNKRYPGMYGFWTEEKRYDCVNELGGSWKYSECLIIDPILKIEVSGGVAYADLENDLPIEIVDFDNLEDVKK